MQSRRNTHAGTVLFDSAFSLSSFPASKIEVLFVAVMGITDFAWSPSAAAAQTSSGCGGFVPYSFLKNIFNFYISRIIDSFLLLQLDTLYFALGFIFLLEKHL